MIRTYRITWYGSAQSTKEVTVDLANTTLWKTDQEIENRLLALFTPIDTGSTTIEWTDTHVQCLQEINNV